MPLALTASSLPPVVPEPASVVMGATSVLVGLGSWCVAATLAVANPRRERQSL
jgi:hypothetical protein